MTMIWLDELRAEPTEYRVMYAWARALEWEIFPAFISQPLVPLLYVLLGWKQTLFWILGINFVWNLVFCTAVISLQLAAFGMLWAKLKWFSIAGYGIYFGVRREWGLLGLTMGVPVIMPALGALIIRHPTKIIQEFMLLTLGLEHTPPSPQVEKYLKKLEKGG